MSERDPLIGVAIGRFIIRTKLAHGGMGAVYKASHAELATVQKVVKVLLPEFSRNEQIRQRFRREATAAARLRHRNIIAIDDFGALPDGQLFLMMPFLDGKPLDTHIQQNVTLTQHHTFHIIVQVCRALQHLHDAGLVHRDLKPGNVFLTETDDNPYEVTLLDLGIARDLAEDVTARKTQTGMSLGTPGYMAVEQYGTAGSASPSADIYAAAIITWEMLTGQMPWGIDEPAVLYHRQMTLRPEPRDGVAIEPALLALLRKALSPNPKQRPASAREFAVAFASLTPAIPPHVPSGADILARFAKEFVHNASPLLQTVRNSVQPDRAAPVLWPMRSTQVPHLPNEVPIIGLPPSVPLSLVTVNERSKDAIAVAARLTPPRAGGKRHRFAILAAALCATAAIATFGMLHSRNSSRSLEPAASKGTDAAVRELTVPRDAGQVPADAAAFLDAAADANSSTAAPPDASVAPPTPATTGIERKHKAIKTPRSVPPDAGVAFPSAPIKVQRSTPLPDAGVAAPQSNKPKIDPDAVE